MTRILPIVTLNFDGRVVLHNLCFNSTCTVETIHI